MNKIVLFYIPKLNYFAKRFKEESSNLNIQIDSIPYPDLFVEISKSEVKFFNKDVQLDLVDTTIIFKTKHAGWNAITSLMNYLSQSNRILNFEAYSSPIGTSNKLYQYLELAKSNVQLIPTGIDFSNERNRFIKKSEKYIEKPLIGSGGAKIRMVNENTDPQTTQFNLIQQYIPGNNSIRVIVLNGSVIGAVKKYIDKDDITSNKKLGEVIKVGDELAEKSLAIASQLKLEFTGLDFIEFDGKYYFLEANLVPEVGQFEKVTNINVIRLLLEYLINSSTPA